MTSSSKITIVTPNFNGADYLEECIQSVISQGRDNLQYVVIDGGSTDGSVDVIRKYQEHIDYWVSEPDAGPADAIRKGFLRAKGQWLGWLNSDDYLFPQALRALADICAAAPSAKWITGCRVIVSQDGSPVQHGGRWYENGLNHLVGDAQGLAQEATFFTREIYDQVGGINTQCKSIFDRELFLRMFERVPPVFTTAVLGVFRKRPGQLSLNEDARRSDYEMLDEIYRRRPLRVRAAHRVAKTRFNASLIGVSNYLLGKAWFSDAFGLRIVTYDDAELRWKEGPYHDLSF